MSVRTWKHEYFSGIVTASKDPLSAAEHSLRKWKGLDDDTLAKHNLAKVEGHHIINSTKTGAEFEVGAPECALCRYTHKLNEYGSCYGCPLAEATGRVCTDDDAPYTKWLNNGNNAPMVKALERTINWIKAKQQG